jgi:hypothetical protein
MAGPTIELPRIPSAETGAIGLDDGAVQLRMFLRLIVAATLGFAACEAILALAFRDLAALVGAIGLALFGMWTAAWCLPRVGRSRSTGSCTGSPWRCTCRSSRAVCCCATLSRSPRSCQSRSRCRTSVGANSPSSVSSPSEWPRSSAARPTSCHRPRRSHEAW